MDLTIVDLGHTTPKRVASPAGGGGRFYQATERRDLENLMIANAELPDERIVTVNGVAGNPLASFEGPAVCFQFRKGENIMALGPKGNQVVYKMPSSGDGEPVIQRGKQHHSPDVYAHFARRFFEYREKII